MRHFTRSFNIDQPTTALFQPALLRQHPHVVEIGDYWGRYGSGIGLGNSAGFSSLGEFYERRHFFSEVSSHRRALLHETLEVEEAMDFTVALQQSMINSESTESLSTHTFNKTPVKRLSNFSDCEIPTVCISISPQSLGADNNFLPIRDTCGCSFHWSLEGSIFGAIKESIERQFLLRFWLTRQCESELNLIDHQKDLTSSGSLPLLQALQATGQVVALDITGPGFPGKCIIVLYGANDPKHYVHYCAGMAYSHSGESALEKAIYELWQTFRFIRNFHTFKGKIESIKDPYLRHFLSVNHNSTFLEIKNALPENKTQNNKNILPLTRSTLINAIQQTGISGYVYIKPTQINKKSYFFCKYISPRAFMHMNNSLHINTNNIYSENFTHKIDPARQNMMVPFP
ncbi:MAG: YcaO-like family protein [Pseudomonas sp.]|uniref:YcaO-like family protein n=1 Tax=Pseudomonas sp. TaxID=306 RepID=UPI003D0B1565